MSSSASWLRRHWGKLAVLTLFAAFAAAHFGIGARARLTPPDITLPSGEVRHVGSSLRRFGASYALARGKLLEVGLRGTASEIGFEHARLLYPEMLENEGILLGRFKSKSRIPWPAECSSTWPSCATRTSIAG